MTDTPTSSPMVLRAADIQSVDRGTGVSTLPFIGKWSVADGLNTVTTGITTFGHGTRCPLHTHNVDETALILEGMATVIIGDQQYELEVNDATWVPREVPHQIINRGDGPLRVYWVYGGGYVTRTTCSTRKTVVQLSAEDQWAAPAA